MILRVPFHHDADHRSPAAREAVNRSRLARCAYEAFLKRTAGEIGDDGLMTEAQRLEMEGLLDERAAAAEALEQALSEQLGERVVA